MQFITYDDAYNLTQVVTQTIRLVEQDKVLATVGALGTEPQQAVRAYLNKNKVPQLYVSTGATFWGAQQKEWKWSLGWQPDYQGEGAIYGRRIKANTPNAKIGIIYQNDDYGKDYIAGLEAGLGLEQEPDRGHARLQPHRRVRCSPAARSASIGCGHVDDLRHADAHDPHVRDAAGDQLEAGQRLPELGVGHRHVHDARIGELERGDGERLDQRPVPQGPGQP